MTYTAYTTDSEATQSLGVRLGRLLKGGEVIELAGDLGSGKTTLTRGIAAGMGSEDDVVSPTFTLSRVYDARAGLSLYHFDFYRLGGHDIVTEELEEVMQNSRIVTVIEWAGQGDAKLPERRLRITLNPGEHENEREILVECLSSALSYVLEGLQR